MEFETSHYCLFGEPWWLDAACGPGGWDEVRVESGGRLEARLPYVVRRRRGVTTVGMPMLTQTLGPWFAPYCGKYSNALAREKDLVDELVGNLPRHQIFNQAFHPAVTNGLPWHWHGFSNSVRYSYVLDPLSDMEKIWKEMRSNIRGDIRKAEGRAGLIVRDDLDLDVLLRVCGGNPNKVVVRRVVEAAIGLGSGAMLFAVDSEGNVHAAVFTVWDQRATYYLLGGGDPALRNSGAQSLLVWEAIRRAARVSRSFDFEGSMIEPVERFFRAFGARQSGYLAIKRYSGRTVRTAVHLRAGTRAFFGG